MLRCADTRAEERVLQRIDRMFGEALSDILNIDLDGTHLNQIRLPARLGGLGIRSTHDLASPCILSSLHATERLIQSLLPGAQLSAIFSTLTELVDDFCAPGRSPPEKKHKQREWDVIFYTYFVTDIYTILYT